MAVTTEDAADLGRCRRGIEPLRVVVMPQYDRQVASAGVEPMVPIDLSLLYLEPGGRALRPSDPA